MHTVQQSLLVVISLLLASAFFWSRPVVAQTNTTSTQPAKQTYRAQLDRYRTADRQYVIALEQYKQLKTLTALEELVKQTHETMKVRNDVLISYLSLLLAELDTATGINLDQKVAMKEALAQDIKNLQAFGEELQPEANRVAINELATTFASIAASLENDAYKVQTLLALGKLQTIYDKSSSLRAEIEDLTLQKQDIKQSQRQRANAEIKANLTEVKLQIDEVVNETERAETDFSRSAFSNLLDDLTSVYVGLAQTLAYLNELLVM